MGRITLEGYCCERCGHRWVARNKEEPRVCPRCKSPYWDRPRKLTKKGGRKWSTKKSKS
ncbi:MAG: hypothetical protein KKB21_04805 [Nanoarchaeota archaeon]|nr:hypothetical protein [Nanoarchaeota archaeon]